MKNSMKNSMKNDLNKNIRNNIGKNIKNNANKDIKNNTKKNIKNSTKKDMKKNRVDEFIKNPKKALLTLALPFIVGMVVQVLYSIADTAFVGRLGSDALAALTFAWPIFFIAFALNGGIAAGMSSRVASYVGAKKKKEAENDAMHGIMLSLCVAVLLFAFGMPTLKPLLSMLGATGPALVMATEYLSILLMGIVFMYMSFILSNVFSSQGDTKTPMYVQVSALLLNIILDPILIYGFRLGVKGAAIATLIAFMFGFILNLYFIRTRSYLHIRRKSFHFSFKLLKEIFQIGAPTVVSMLLMSFSFLILNKFMAGFGTEYVAALGMVGRLDSTAIMPIMALAMSLMTLCGMFYGAKRYDLLRSITWYGIRIGVIYTVAIGMIFFLFPRIFLMIFSNDKTIIDIAVPYLRIDVFDFWMLAVGIIASRVMRGIGYGAPGLVMILSRVIVILLPLAYIFVEVLKWGYLSLVFATVTSAFVFMVVGVVWLEILLKKCKNNTITS